MFYSIISFMHHNQLTFFDFISQLLFYLPLFIYISLISIIFLNKHFLKLWELAITSKIMNTITQLVFSKQSI